MPFDGPMTLAQKAAAVLVAVGPEVAAGVVRHLPDSDLEALTLEVATLGTLPQPDMAEILGEFRNEVHAQNTLVSGGEHQARELMRRVRGAEGDEVVDRILATVQTAPFHFLRMHEPSEVVQHLREENPQTIALVLAHLPTRFSSALLSGFEPHLQADVARRIALMERTSPEVIASVERALRDRLGAVQRRSMTGKGGVKELATILNQSDRSTERAILTDLEDKDPELAEQVRALMFIFEDIVHLDDRAIQEVLRHVETKQLALALKGVAPDVAGVITRNLSERARQSLEEEIEMLGAVRVRDVEEAQTAIVTQIRTLDEQGAIMVSRPGEGEFID